MPSDTSAASLVAAAQGLAPAIRAARDDIERGRRLPSALLQAMHDAQLFRLFIPRAFGGLEVDPVTSMRVVEIVAAADGAAGWTLMIGTTYGVWAALLPGATAREIYGPHDAVVAGALRPSGRAQVEKGGFVVSGRWSFASGIQHANWWNAGCVIPPEDVAPGTAGAAGKTCLVFFPAHQGRLIENWDVGGLRGTGSHDHAIDRLFVPETHVISLDDRPRVDGALYRLPLQALLDSTMAAVGLGIARAAIDAVVSLARDKRSADRPSVQADVGRAEAALRSARAWLYESVEEAWVDVQAGRTATTRQAAILRLARSHCAAAAAHAVDFAYSAGGGSAIYAAGLIERCFRDVHTLTQHVSMHAANYEVCGRVLLGLPPDCSRL
jgi:alkylation response protein AidB-like acyl-CoA dehydrogenase